jgi:hypothetical protein
MRGPLVQLISDELPKKEKSKLIFFINATDNEIIDI